MSDVIERLRAANPVPRPSAPDPDLLWRWVDEPEVAPRARPRRLLPSVRFLIPAVTVLASIAIFIAAVLALDHHAPAASRPAPVHTGGSPHVPRFARSERAVIRLLAVLRQPAGTTVADRVYESRIVGLTAAIGADRTNGTPIPATFRIAQTHGTEVFGIAVTHSARFGYGAEAFAFDRHLSIAENAPTLAAQIAGDGGWQSGGIALGGLLKSPMIVRDGVKAVLLQVGAGPTLRATVVGNIALFTSASPLYPPVRLTYYGAGGKVLRRISIPANRAVRSPPTKFVSPAGQS